MKYLSKSFSTPANSKAYVDNWESVFGESAQGPTEQPPEQCGQCGADVVAHHACEGVPGGFGDD